MSDASVRRLHHAMRIVRQSAVGDRVPAETLVRPLLDLWAAAYQVHPWVSRPVEHFLTSLEGRPSVASSDLETLAEDVHLLLLEVRSLTGAADQDGESHQPREGVSSPVAGATELSSG